jgi:hypothetical protein
MKTEAQTTKQVENRWSNPQNERERREIECARNAGREQPQAPAEDED